MATQKLYGLGFSPLSVENASQAFDQEMVANKKVGLFGIAENTKLVSQDVLIRSKTQANNFIDYALMHNAGGDLYKLQFGTQFATILANNGTELVSSVEFTNAVSNKPSGLAFNLDVDAFIINGSVLIDSNLFTCKVKVRIKRGSSTYDFYLKNAVGEDPNLAELNSTIFDISSKWSNVTNSGTYQVAVVSVIVAPVAGFDYVNNRVAVYDMLMSLVH